MYIILLTSLLVECEKKDFKKNLTHQAMMNINKDWQNHFQKIYLELEEEVDKATKDTTIALNNYRMKYRVCVSSGDIENEILLAKEAEWNKIHQKMKTLQQILKILKDNKNELGIYDALAIDRELMSYTILSAQKGLDAIAKTFSSYRKILFE